MREVSSRSSLCEKHQNEANIQVQIPDPEAIAEVPAFDKARNFRTLIFFFDSKKTIPFEAGTLSLSLFHAFQRQVSNTSAETLFDAERTKGDKTILQIPGVLCANSSPGTCVLYPPVCALRVKCLCEKLEV